ncbi:uncharacterized protein GVI51_J06193 [Nakaseomyces glabratus]|uniref:Uncharacterized protein n=1 Tax=Candida glabrata (strain ATCC 2001 / BCRC 20586 / JCM 3761 / NBRC 0622 / NRRL Y-65 / CBS 138) TaxID=284593 RepID=Q6FP61_CANGA|nr:uncharacterized protein CAGL0J06358g [Nakaseomyces glabratus]KAH7598401.1 hypothetical protein J7294_03271 [Nakaseomyces glabratus]KAH7603830.1 hypothetical protein J7293_03384 [Nakaseomyces glabratus]QHS67636.1 uncharacterized protein GVI51_J06193 [Nakaseomyces glabratus]CAG60934.1 unnamed protein product [Nakaseomyces glabratus]|eukprot:XP_447983.1 uncharacterized protein CAGL0J06358g [[Candida] glabrata]
MVRISSAASYFMPLLCSKKPSVVVSAVFVVTLIYSLAYLSSTILPNAYDDPNMFAPNSQDYFRTFLLGFFSPCLLYLTRSFLLSVNPNQRFINLILDFPINDSFLLLIIIGLAYPQIQDGHGIHTKNDGDDASAVQWHIIPKQSYIFGISWSLSEFIICAISNLFEFQEVSIAGQLNSKEDSEIDVLNRKNSLNRENITLSKCIGVRRKSSTISNNVYTNDADPEVSTSKYGTLTYMDYTSWDKFRKSNFNSDEYGREANKNITTDKTGRDPLIIINPKDNSLRITSLNREGNHLEFEESEPIFKDKRGFTWVRWKEDNYLENQGNMLDSDTTSIRHANVIERLTSNGGQKSYFTLKGYGHLGKNFFIMSVVIFSNIWMTIGQSLLMSIYFIYVRGHEKLFSDTVIFFGSKDITYFLLVVFIPFVSMNFLINTYIYLQDTLVEWFIDPYFNMNGGIGASLNNQYPYYPIVENSLLFPNKKRVSTANSKPTRQDLTSSYDSALLMESAMLYGSHNNADDYDANDPKPLKLAKRMIIKWKEISASDQFVLSAMFIWGLSVFVCGLFATIPSFNIPSR